MLATIRCAAHNLRVRVRRRRISISGTRFVGPRFIFGAVASTLTQIPSIAEVTVATNLCESRTMKIVRFEGNREAREALTLSVTGVLAVMLVWNLMMLLFY
jgi:hypothetical protein